MGFSRQVKYILGSEACERFSFYGVRAILVVYMIERLALPATSAWTTFRLFAAVCALSPILGAYLSDRIWGKYKTTLALSLIACVGYAFLTLFETEATLGIGLLLIAIGSGGIKPGLTTLLGDQLDAGDPRAATGAFGAYYFLLNLGSALSALLIPWLLAKLGPSVAFGVPGLLAGCSALLIWWNREQFLLSAPARESGKAGLGQILFHVFRHRKSRKPRASWLDVARERFSAEDVDSVRAVLELLKLLAVTPLFWALFDESAMIWAGSEPKMLQWANPWLVMAVIPALVYGLRLTPLRKIGAGMVLTALAFVAAGAIRARTDSGAPAPHAFWQLAPLLLVACSEAMVSIGGLELAYARAPRSMAATTMALWLLTAFAGGLLDSQVAKLGFLHGALEYYSFAALTLAVAGVFALIASKRRTT